MIDWTKPMMQTFEYYVVNPISWRDERRINNVLSSSINRSNEKETLGNATVDLTEVVDECYIRIYLRVTQGNETKRVALATVLAQTPTFSFDGKKKKVSMDCYTPLIELKEKYPPLGYFIPKDTKTLDKAYALASSNMRAPLIKTTGNDHTVFSDFVANTDDTWLSYITDLLYAADHELELDGYGTVMFAPIQSMAAKQPVWTYNDDNSSILYPELSDSRDIYGVPNVVEVIYSGDSGHFYSKVVNEDPQSITSTIRRGREICYRDTEPRLGGNPTQELVDDYAARLLESLSTIEHSLSYKHGYAPVNVGDCVRLNYERAGYKNIKAMVTTQTIECTTGCSVSETAIYTEKLWDRSKVKVES